MIRQSTIDKLHDLRLSAMSDVLLGLKACKIHL